MTLRGPIVRGTTKRNLNKSALRGVVLLNFHYNTPTRFPSPSSLLFSSLCIRFVDYGIIIVFKVDARQYYDTSREY